MSEAKHNPKHIRAQKEGKIPFEYLVLSVLEDDAWVHKGGGDKYGIRNWTIDEILASTYVGAMFRHFRSWAMGEDLDPESGKPHLTHLRACCAVVMDGQKHGKLIDDRLKAESKDPETGEIKQSENALYTMQDAVEEIQRERELKIPEKQYIVYVTRNDGTPFPSAEALGPFSYQEGVRVATNVSGLTRCTNVSTSLVELKPSTEG